MLADPTADETRRSTRRFSPFDQLDEAARALYEAVIHDLFGLGLSLQTAVLDGDAERLRVRADAAVGEIDRLIGAIRALIVRSLAGEEPARDA